MAFNLGDMIGKIAPMLVSSLVPGGPFIGMAVSSVISALEPDHPAVPQIQAAQAAGGAEGALQKITDLFQQGVLQATHFKAAEDAQKVKLAELGYKNVADLEAIAAGDRKSARDSSVAGGTAKMLFWLSLLLLGVTIGSEVAVLFLGYPKTVPDIVVGRVLGLMDATTMMVLSFWYGTTSHNQAAQGVIADIAKGAS